MTEDHKTVIFCFSATGNSLKLARDMASEIGSCKVEQIKENTPVVIDDNYAGRIGFVFPVHAYGLPIIVRRFLKNLAIKGTPYIFAAVTCAGRPAAALIQLKKYIARKGKILSAGFIINMPGSYLPLHDLQEPYVIDRMYKVEETSVKYLAERIKNKENYGIEAGKYSANRFVSFLVYLCFYFLHNIFDIFFRADGRCDGCGLCAHICPAGNISMADGRPKWRRRCVQCMACLQWCPVESIQFFNTTKGKKRYKNPYVNPWDIIPR